MKVSIIVVNWNGQHFLKPCLESLRLQTYGHYEIILVDNGSTDDSVHLVRDLFPDVNILQFPENKGFAGGNIEGLKACEGTFIALINNDTRAAETWLENLVQPMASDQQVGICASKLITDDGAKIDSAGDGVTTAGVGFKRGMGLDPAFYSAAEYAFGACGAAALYRREMLDDIGFLDEMFFLNEEDTDLNFRAQLAGWKCAFVPSAIVYHKVNATINRLSDLHVYYHARNLEFLWLKNMPLGLITRFAHHKLIQEVGSFCYLCLRHGRWKAFYRAKRDAVRMLPVVLRRRREVQAKKRISNTEVRQRLTSIFRKELIRQKVDQFIGG